MQHESGDGLKVVGASGQISLGKRYAGKALRVETRDDGTILLTPVVLVPESQMWTLAEPDRSRISRGMAWAGDNPPRKSELAALSAKAGADRPRRGARRRGKP